MGVEGESRGQRWSPESAQNDHGGGQRHQRRAVADRVQGLNGGIVRVLVLGHRGLDPRLLRNSD